MTADGAALPTPSGLTARKVATAVLLLVLAAAAIALRLWGAAQQREKAEERNREVIAECLATTQPGQQVITCAPG
jgi:hypothetical protein